MKIYRAKLNREILLFKEDFIGDLDNTVEFASFENGKVILTVKEGTVNEFTEQQIKSLNALDQIEEVVL
ncbi:hypothetical protein [Priestia endophytica]|uniref:hypothetical protein n=1 Tax=Priestia endophytica TaxID=135735 RepID=UPI000DCA87DC|nr:hypothetical protein [Priestia endophytica]RAS73224.1 hypothetical protein A4R27_24865 [Priestia endophytica]